jgi:pseudouridine synthase
VGRLDYHSEGLLLLTNDGEFAHRLTAPANHVTKTYVVKVNGALTEAQEKQFRDGIPMHGRRTSPAELKRIKHGPNPWYEVKITEGRQNQIRIMFKHFGKLVEKLRRVKIGFLELDVAPARYRSLTQQEVEKFRRVLKLNDVGNENPASNAAAESKLTAASTGTPSAPKPAPKPGRHEPGSHMVAGSKPRIRNTGPRNTGPRNAGRRDSGPRNAAPRNATRDAAPQAAGPRNAGPRNAGRRDGGARRPPHR